MEFVKSMVLVKGAFIQCAADDGREPPTGTTSTLLNARAEIFFPQSREYPCGGAAGIAVI